MHITSRGQLCNAIKTGDNDPCLRDANTKEHAGNKVATPFTTATTQSQ